MSRALVLPGVALALAVLASCAAISGLADKEAVDCPGGCPDSAAPPRPTSTSTSPDGSAPIVDSGSPEADAAPGFVKPDGWQLVAVAVPANGAAAPECPTGFDEASDIGTNPTAPGNTCECAACNVGQQAACTGAPQIVLGTGGVCDFNVGGGTSYTNSPAGGCNDDFSTTTDRTGRFARVELAPPTGGSCAAAAATPHRERVQFAERRRVCDETARCSGNICDANVPAPFEVCVASAKGTGDAACPVGFPNKLVAGGADVTCNSSLCTCTVTRTPCVGSFTYYKDANCTLGAAGVTADDTCRNLNATGSYATYKVAASTTTGCTVAGSSAASVVQADVRTVCCP